MDTSESSRICGFETLEDAVEKSKPPPDREWPILLYSTHVVLSSFALILVGQWLFYQAENEPNSHSSSRPGSREPKVRAGNAVDHPTPEVFET